MKIFFCTFCPIKYRKHLSASMGKYFPFFFFFFREPKRLNLYKESFDKETLQLLIISLIFFCKMLYCSTVWSNTSTQNINKLQSIQNLASKIVTNSRKSEHVTPLLRQLNWLPVKQLLYYREHVLTYKCFNGLAPKYLVDKFIKRSVIHACHTRKRDLLHTSFYSIELLPAKAHLHLEELVFGTI